MNDKPQSIDIRRLPKDEAKWIPVAVEVLEGKYDGAKGSLKKSVLIGLRATAHPVAEQAAQRLELAA
jgi:hypothetical protein